MATQSEAQRIDADDVHTIEAREHARRSLEADVEAFLKEGGKIENIPRNLRADPPRKPENNYGRGSI